MDRDVSKTGALAREEMARSRRSRFFGSFEAARKVLRGNKVNQGGVGIQTLKDADPQDVTLFYLDGEPHRARRAAIAPFFSLRAIEDRYEPVMHRCADMLVARLAHSGREDLGALTFRYAVAVTAEVLGLDYFDLDALTGRFGAILDEGTGKRTTRDFDDPALLEFFAADVQPAIDARRQTPGEDVISTMIARGHDDRFIRTEVRGYAVAGMVTTREFICMVAWYLLERPEMLDRFRNADAAGQFAILDEVIRVEPVVSVLKREAVAAFDVPGLGAVAPGDILAVDVRAANFCEDVVGACPHAFDPDRRNRMPPKSGYMSFGDGPHRCPGAMLSMHETRIFLDRLVQLPGLRLVSQPRVTWYRPISSYEVKDIVLACDKAG